MVKLLDGLDLDPTPPMENPLVIIAPRHHPLAVQQKIPLARLQDEVFVAREQRSGTRIAMERFFRERGLQLKIRMEMTSNSAIERAVMAGLGLGVVSIHTPELEPEAGRLVILDVEGFPIERYWRLDTYASKRLPPVAQPSFDLPDGRRRRPAHAARADAVRPAALSRVAAMLLLLPCCALGAPLQDGDWELSINGHNSYLFGEPGFGGGLRIPWEVVIRFRVEAGEYLAGSGSARWLDRIETLSHPPDWFACRQVEGTYLDSNLTLHETPRVRFAGFPVAGEVSDGRVRLRPGYEPPGNYLAVTYECSNDFPFADNWFALAERGKQILGKRQDAEKKRDGASQHARVREVGSLPPEGSLDLPLRDDWRFVQGGPDDDLFVSYRLKHLE